MIGFVGKRKPLRRLACLACLSLLALRALPAQAEVGYVELGEDSKGAWSLYLPSVEERTYRTSLDSIGYIVGWVQVVYKDEAGNESEKTSANIAELSQGSELVAQALELVVRLAKMLDSDESYRGMFLYAANKELMQVQRLSAAYYDEGGGEISSSSEAFSPYLWKECPPGSMDEKIWQALMKAAGKK